MFLVYVSQAISLVRVYLRLTTRHKQLRVLPGLMIECINLFRCITFEKTWQNCTHQVQYQRGANPSGDAIRPHSCIGPAWNLGQYQHLPTPTNLYAQTVTITQIGRKCLKIQIEHNLQMAHDYTMSAWLCTCILLSYCNVFKITHWSPGGTTIQLPFPQLQCKPSKCFLKLTLTMGPYIIISPVS